jgi:hypothetical protein
LTSFVSALKAADLIPPDHRSDIEVASINRASTPSAETQNKALPSRWLLLSEEGQINMGAGVLLGAVTFDRRNPSSNLLPSDGSQASRVANSIISERRENYSIRLQSVLSTSRDSRVTTPVDGTISVRDGPITPWETSRSSSVNIPGPEIVITSHLTHTGDYFQWFCAEYSNALKEKFGQFSSCYLIIGCMAITTEGADGSLENSKVFAIRYNKIKYNFFGLGSKLKRQSGSSWKIYAPSR